MWKQKCQMLKYMLPIMQNQMNFLFNLKILYSSVMMFFLSPTEPVFVQAESPSVFTPSTGVNCDMDSFG